MTDIAAGLDEARRSEAVRGFQAARGRYPGMMDTFRRSRLAEIEADDRAEETPARESAVAEL